ncbi:MAG TPA: integrase [Prevotella sp.]|nr:integrase [Prevotella sp.]
MCSNSIKKSKKSIINFVPPTRHDGKSSYISFEMRDPATDRLRRKKYMLDRYKKGRIRNYMAAQIIANIYNKVQNGWNPWIDAPSRRGSVKILTVIERYRLYISNINKKGVLKDKTKTDYLNRLKHLEEYIHDNCHENMMAYQVNITFIVDFLDYILLDRDDSARTRNNYRTWLSAFCSWMIEKRYIEQNPCTGISNLHEDSKKRQPLTHNQLHELSSYLQHANKQFLLAVMMEYYTLIRPTELTYLRIKDISINKQSIYISHEISKNRHDSVVALNDKVLNLMNELHIFDRPGQYYLFGHGLLPNKERIASNIFRYQFAKIREHFNWPDSLQFYSLKDSGIRDLANAEGVVAARDQARHADVHTTNMYLQGRDRLVDEDTKHFKGEL